MGWKTSLNIGQEWTILECNAYFKPGGPNYSKSSVTTSEFKKLKGPRPDILSFYQTKKKH